MGEEVDDLNYNQQARRSTSSRSAEVEGIPRVPSSSSYSATVTITSSSKSQQESQSQEEQQQQVPSTNCNSSIRRSASRQVKHIILLIFPNSKVND